MLDSEIKDHWSSMAAKFGKQLYATTKCPTIKLLEIAALRRAIARKWNASDMFDILEPGCGNGVNCIALADAFPRACFKGSDYVPEMVMAARQLAVEVGGIAGSPTCNFVIGDVMTGAPGKFDVIFTDRCLINLNTIEKQKQAITGLASNLKPGGMLLLIENCKQTHASQNTLREVVGLEPRKAVDYNLFFDEPEILNHVRGLALHLEGIEDFGSLHDILLYVLVPAINGGEIDYHHPIIEAGTKIAKELPNAFGAYGQNRLYIFTKPGASEEPLPANPPHWDGVQYVD